MKSRQQVGTGARDVRITLYPAPAVTYRQLVLGLASRVSQVPDRQLAELAEVLEPLRGAVMHALATVPNDRVALHSALFQLAVCLEGGAAGRMPGADQLSVALVGAVQAIGEEPASPPTVANALERATGVIAAVCGRLLSARA